MKAVIAIVSLVIGFAVGFLVDRKLWHQAFEESSKRRKKAGKKTTDKGYNHNRR